MLPPSETSSPAQPDSVPCYSHEERSLLIEIAHEAILSSLAKRDLVVGTPSAHLCEPRGVFSTLYLNGRLRGCVGYPGAVMPLYRAVAETARAAAFSDPRFPPVSREESPGLGISLSVLSPLWSIAPENVIVGVHGLVVSEGGLRGLMLPQVAVEHGWSRFTFLEQTCKKAGLPLEAWRHGAKIEAFTAEVFGGEESGRLVKTLGG